MNELRDLLALNGIDLDGSDDSISDLDTWFFHNIEPDPDVPGRLLPMWYSVCRDIGLFLGDIMIKRHPNLRWEFFIWGRSNVSYQKHVIMGFGAEDPKHRTNLDVDRAVATYGHRIVADRGSVQTYGTVDIRGVNLDLDAVLYEHKRPAVHPDQFQQLLNTAARRA
ncbi:hypothetical protein [Arthrobacter sp. RCC_34]|uniref:hypothetical protein n=1 Tax=Arthrobacter sp. RCC_34 TaxID=3239230 RepID=UPI003524A8D6